MPGNPQLAWLNGQRGCSEWVWLPCLGCKVARCNLGKVHVHIRLLRRAIRRRAVCNPRRGYDACAPRHMHRTTCAPAPPSLPKHTHACTPSACLCGDP